MSKRVLVGITSSIAAYKTYELIRFYKKEGYEVKTVLTENALNFVSPLVLKTLSENEVYYNQFSTDFDIKHINLTAWADCFVVAPVSANTISKMANGISDNLLTSIFCAFLGTKKPILLAPAMNTDMWNNPIIQENILKLKNLNVEFVDPEDGFLACGTIGKGRLASIDKIFNQTKRILFQNKKNHNKKIVVTLGGTKEPIDSVRFITNSSSGKMGISLCDWAYYLGFDVVAISTVELNKPYKVINVKTADEMLSALQNEEFDYLIMAAAVSDFKVKNKNETKISKEDIENEFNLELIKNPDVVKTIAQNKNQNQIIAGFCLTDKDLINCAKNKLKNKNLDFIIANDISALNNDTNKVTIIDKNDRMIDIKEDTKENIARKILEVVCD